MNNMPAAKNRRVLVIDDNRSIHDDFRKILTPVTATAAAFDVAETALFGRPAEAVGQTQFEVDSAYQGQEGVLLVKNALEAGLPYAMAFVDVRMPPGWDGVETTRKIWELDPNLQVVLCTAYSDYSWGEMFEKLGHSDGLLILKKPFDAVEAFQLAHALTEKWWLHQESRRKMEELENRVTERTRDLEEANHALQREVVEHQRAEETLRESNEKFHQLADNITDAFWIRSPDMSEVHYISPAFERIWGRSVESLCANPHQWVDFILPEDRERVTAAFAALTGEALNLDIEYRIVRPAGDIRWVRVRGFQVRDVADKLIRHIGIVTDITERKRADEAMRESEERFSGAFEYAPIGVALVSPEGRWLKVNRALCDLVGYSQAELLTRTFQDITHPADLEGDLENARRLLAGEIRAYQIEKRYIHARGHLVPVLLNVSLVRDDQGRPRYFISQIQDITERKQAEEALRTSRQIMDGVINAIPVRVFWKDKNLVYLGCNAVFAGDAGFADPKDIIGKDDYQMGWRDQAELYREGDRQIIESGSPKFLVEESQTTPEGNTITLLTSKIPLRSSQGEISGVIGTYMDITERKRLEAHLFQSQKMETVGKLAGGVAHEFNSIMTAIIGQSELLLNDLPPGNPLCKNATEIRKAAGRAATLTRQLLAYGRKQILQPEILDLNAVLAGMETTLRHLMGRGTDIHIAPAAGLKAVKADAGQIEQVIMNIAMNAADAMPNGGKLTLETANVTLDQEYVSKFPELKAGEYVMLAITDTGAGMGDEVKARVFEPFFSTKGVGQGTGLGLSTCYGIIKQSGGHIGTYSEPARGAIFKIYLPQVEHEAKIPVQRLDSPDLPRGTETILLVEDDPAMREMAATLLGRLGYKVLSAANGIEALGLKQQPDTGHIDLLFTDVVMPHMSGKELADRVRALYPHTRILFTSAYTENAIVHQGVLDKGVALLQKPFTPSALARKLREVLDE